MPQYMLLIYDDEAQRAAATEAEMGGLMQDYFAYTDSLTLDQARLPDVIVALQMLGADVTHDHGGPVRLYVAPMYGYKSVKWLNRITVADSA